MRSSRGQALVEAAVLLPVLVLMLLLAIDLGRVFFVTSDLRNAAHEATMLGGTRPTATCAEIKVVVDRQMDRVGPDDAACSTLGADGGRAYITTNRCEAVGAGLSCDPSWSPPYPANADLRYHVRLEYRFQPVLPLVGLLTGNGLGGTVPLSVENRSPVLISYGN